MSWSASGIGKPLALAAKIEANLTTYRCVEPEETVKKAALGVIKAALEAQDHASVVKVTASGHQSGTYSPDGTAKGISNTLSINIEPVYGFVE